MEIRGYGNKVGVHLYVQTQPRTAGDVQDFGLFSTPHLIASNSLCRDTHSQHTHTCTYLRQHDWNISFNRSLQISITLSHISSQVHPGESSERCTRMRRNSGHAGENTHTHTHTTYMCVCFFFSLSLAPKQVASALQSQKFTRCKQNCQSMLMWFQNDVVGVYVWEN